MPTKTFLELQIAYREIFDKEPITDADKLGRIASLNLFNNSRWVSVDVLRQVFKKAEVICYAANGDEIIMYDPKILKEVLVGLEPEEAKKS